MSKEIEIRNELFNEEEVLSFFADKGITLSKSRHQVDTYYDNPDDSFFKDPDHVNHWIRIREENGNLTFCYKHWLPEGAEIRTYCEEKEYSMDSKQEITKHLKNLGFSKNFVPFITTDKFRKCFMYKDCEVSIDKVKNLGSYIEIEYKGKNDNIEKAIGLLNEILNEIGAKVGPADYKGYVYHLWKKQTQEGSVFK